MGLRLARGDRGGGEKGVCVMLAPLRSFGRLEENLSSKRAGDECGRGSNKRETGWSEMQRGLARVCREKSQESKGRTGGQVLLGDAGEGFRKSEAF